MKTTKQPQSSNVIAWAALLATAVMIPVRAQPVVNTTVNAVGGVTGGLGVGGGAAGGSIGGAASGTGSGAIGAGGSGSFGGAALPSEIRASGAFETIGMRQQRLAAESRTSAPALGSSAALRAGPSASDIRAANADARTQLASDLDARIAASAKSMTATKAQAKALRGDAQAEFKAASRDVDTREKELKASVKAARRASAEAWPEARANVAANYEAYAHAVSRAETVAASNEVNANVKR
jgi:hypothetical protein